VDASCSHNGGISARVEIELSAGSIRTAWPFPRESIPISILLRRHTQPITRDAMVHLPCLRTLWRSAERGVHRARWSGVLDLARSLNTGERNMPTDHHHSRVSSHNARAALLAAILRRLSSRSFGAGHLITGQGRNRDCGSARSLHEVAEPLGHVDQAKQRFDRLPLAAGSG
jgi:hypothetical protein